MDSITLKSAIHQLFGYDVAESARDEDVLEAVGGLAIKILSGDRDMIAYRPILSKMTGSVTAAILLQQVAYWDDKMEGEFYKFKEPCEHELYKPGDSWCEELGFTRREFDTALRKIGTKITKGASKFEAMEKDDKTGMVLYWTDAGRVTHYWLNKRLLGKGLIRLYLEKRESAFT